MSADPVRISTMTPDNTGVMTPDDGGSPRVHDEGWGFVEVEGVGRLRDAKLWPGGGRAWDWNETGTHHRPGIQPADVAELLEHGPDVVVLSRGRALRLETPQAIRRRRGGKREGGGPGPRGDGVGHLWLVGLAHRPGRGGAPRTPVLRPVDPGPGRAGRRRPRHRGAPDRRGTSGQPAHVVPR